MSMIITEKILAAHAGRASVRPNEILHVRLDIVLAHDLTMQSVLNVLQELDYPPVFHRDKVAVVLEHVVPSNSVAHANVAKRIRSWAREQKLTHFYDMGRHGIVHAFLPELGLVRPGMLAIGADSHTCTMGCVGAFATGVGATDAAVGMVTGETWLKVPPAIKVVLTGRPRAWVSAKDVMLEIMGRLGTDGARYSTLEFTGEATASMTMDARATMCSMAVEAGAKNGIFASDAITAQWLADRPMLKGADSAQFQLGLRSDPDAAYAHTLEVDVSQLDFLVAAPPSPDNVIPLRDLGKVKIDQVFIGTCTNGRLEDLRVAAHILEGQKIAPGIRMIVVPATQQVMIDASREGLLETLMTAGAVVGSPGCGPCHAMHMGPLADGDVGLYTANRNFAGRQGSPSASAYLASPAVAAATAIAGHIASPLEVRPDLAAAVQPVIAD